MTDKRLINLRVSAEEDALLAAYAERTGRTRTDVLRELIRGLQRRMRAADRLARAPERTQAAVEAAENAA
jgi:uncharacterized protein (DUF1778 family)